GGVRVHVVDVTWSEARRRQGALDRDDDALALRMRRRDVVGVRARAVARDLGVDARTPSPRVLELLEDDDARPFADDEAVASRGEGAARTLRLLVAGRERAHRAEARDAELGEDRFHAARDRHVDGATPDELEA